MVKRYPTLPALCILLYLSACQTDLESSGRYEQQDNLITVDIQPNQAMVFTMSEWIDSIRFILLDTKPGFFAPVPDRISLRGNFLSYLWCSSPSDCRLNVFNLSGDHLLSVHSNPGEKEAISTIFDFELLDDHLHVLHDDKISVFALDDPARPVKSIRLPEFYRTFVKIPSGYICYTPLTSHALTYLDEEGKIINQQMSLANYPTAFGDLLDHFSDITGSEDHYFYLNFLPAIYRIDYETGKYSKAIDPDFGPFSITDSELNQIVRATSQSAIVEAMDKLCGSGQKVCSYFEVADLQDRTYLSFKLLQKMYMLFLEKGANRFYLFDAVDNDSGYPFITVNKRLPVYAGYTDGKSSYLVAVLNPEAVALDQEVSAQPGIPSNWPLIEPAFSPHTNPIIALLKLKDL